MKTKSTSEKQVTVDMPRAHLINDLRALVALNRPIKSTAGVRAAIRAAMDAGENDLAAIADRRLC